MPVRFAKPLQNQRTAAGKPASSSIGGCSRYETVRISRWLWSISERLSSKAALAAWFSLGARRTACPIPRVAASRFWAVESVQVAGDPTPLLVLHMEQLSGKPAQGSLGRLHLGDVFVRDNQAQFGSISEPGAAHLQPDALCYIARIFETELAQLAGNDPPKPRCDRLLARPAALALIQKIDADDVMLVKSGKSFRRLLPRPVRGDDRAVVAENRYLSGQGVE